MIVMKHQQVTVDFLGMVFTACSYLALAGAVWIFLRLLQACFWLPRHLKKQNDVQQMLQEKVDSYEKYLLECEEKEKAMLAECKMDDENAPDEEAYAEKWKERRECLEMLKKELNRVRDGGDAYDWDRLLEEELKLDDDTDATEIQDDEDEKKKKKKKKKEEEKNNEKSDDENIRNKSKRNKKNNENRIEGEEDSKSEENAEDDAEGKKDK